METKNLLNKKITQWLLLVAMLVGCSANAWAEDSYCISVYKNDGSDAKKFTFNGSSGELSCEVSIDNYTGETSDYKYWVGKNNNWVDQKSAEYNLGSENKMNSDYMSSCSSGRFTVKIYTDSGDKNYYPHSMSCIETPVIITYQIKGSWDGWTLHNIGESDFSTNLNTGDYDFVIMPSSGSDYKNKTFTRDNNSQQLEQNGGNAWVKADVVGNYTFSWDADNKTLSVTYPDPEYYVTGNAPGDWGTWYKMTKGSNANEYYYDMTSTGEFKFSDKNGYNETFYKSFSNTGTVTGVTLTNNCSSNNNCNLSSIKSGYTTPIRFWINVSTKNIWATATTEKSCTDPTASDFSLSDNTKTYNGSAQKPTFSNDGDGTISKYYYSNNGGSSWTEYANGPTNAGTYNVKVDVSAGTNYCAATGIVLTQTFTINQKTPTTSDFSLSDNTKTYTGSALKPTFSNAGDGTISKYYYSNNGGSSWTEYANGPTNAGTYKVKVDVAVGTNYSAATGIMLTDEFTITCPTVATPTFTGYSAAVCPGTQVSLTASVSSGAVVTCTYNWNNPNDWTNVSKNDNQFSANANSAGSVTLTVTNGCGNTSAQGTQAVSVKDIPSITSIAAGTGNNECGTGSVTFNSTGATSGATIQWYENSTKKSEGTATSYTLEIAGGSSKTLKAKAVKDGCESAFTEEATGSRRATPIVSKDLASPTAYEVITLSTSLDTEVTWSKTDSESYFVKDQQAVSGNEVTAETIVLKAPAGNYSITTKKSGECDGNINITVGTATETCN